MVDDDVLYRFRLRLFSLAAELGNVRAACRTMGVHPSTYYRWRGPVLRSTGSTARPSTSRST
jgi:transposase-like protein